MQFLCSISFLFAGLSAITGQAYKAEGLFVVDKEVVKSYMREMADSNNRTVQRREAKKELHEDIDYIISEVNNLFASIQVNLTIEIYVKNITVETSRFTIYPSTSMRGNSSNTINYRILSEHFGEWLERNKMYETHKYDFALLWTGFDIYGERGLYTTEYAHLGKICKLKKATGVGEFDKTYATVLTTTRIIAQLLGSDYKGFFSTSIMTTPIIPGVPNRWSFSRCSIDDMKHWLIIISPNCLLTTNPNSTKPTITYESYTGRMFDVDTLCRRVWNDSKAYMYREWQFNDNKQPSGDRLCHSVYCELPESMYRRDAFPSEGMICDVGKRCQRGKCQLNSTTSPNITPDCVFGDQPSIDHFDYMGVRMSCPEGTNGQYRNPCYRSHFRERCCATCNVRYTGRLGCEYGDKSGQCKTPPLDPDSEDTRCDTDENYRNNCCETCRIYDGQ